MRTYYADASALLAVAACHPIRKFAGHLQACLLSSPVQARWQYTATFSPNPVSPLMLDLTACGRAPDGIGTSPVLAQTRARFTISSTTNFALGATWTRLLTGTIPFSPVDLHICWFHSYALTLLSAQAPVVSPLRFLAFLKSGHQFDVQFTSE